MTDLLFSDQCKTMYYFAFLTVF